MRKLPAGELEAISKTSLAIIIMLRVIELEWYVSSQQQNIWDMNLELPKMDRGVGQLSSSCKE